MILTFLGTAPHFPDRFNYATPYGFNLLLEESRITMLCNECNRMIAATLTSSAISPCARCEELVMLYLYSPIGSFWATLDTSILEAWISCTVEPLLANVQASLLFDELFLLREYRFA